MFGRGLSIEDKIRSQLMQKGKCLIWSRSTTRDGYGTIRYKGKTQMTHRLMYELVNGPIPANKVVRHTCDTPPCCNPEHLVLGSVQDNVADRDARGRTDKPKGEKNTSAKLTDKTVLEIRQKYASGKYTQKQLAQEYGVAKSRISDVINRKTWKHI